MKQSRRHELRTNELSIRLQALYEKANRYSTHILVVVLALVVLVLVTNYLRSRRESELQEASAALLEVQRLNPQVEEENAIERARQVVADYGEVDPVGLQARDLLGRMAFQKAQSLNPLTEKDEYVELLKEAQKAYEEIIEKHAGDRHTVAEARMMLAKINESLVVVGEGDAEKIRDLYAKLAESEPGTFKPLAEEALASLDERLEPLRLVEPGSPETQPARNPIPPDEPAETETAPAETVPAAETAPAAETVAGAETAPAVETVEESVEESVDDEGPEATEEETPAPDDETQAPDPARDAEPDTSDDGSDADIESAEAEPTATSTAPSR